MICFYTVYTICWAADDWWHNPEKPDWRNKHADWNEYPLHGRTDRWIGCGLGSLRAAGISSTHISWPSHMIRRLVRSKISSSNIRARFWLRRSALASAAWANDVFFGHSYGHDANEELVYRIKSDLEKRGHIWPEREAVVDCPRRQTKPKRASQPLVPFEDDRQDPHKTRHDQGRSRTRDRG